MIQPDTVKLLNDTTKAMSSDSMARLDTLMGVDSTKLVDTLKAVIQAPTGFVGIPHPSLPQTDSWVFAVILSLFFLFIFSVSKSSSIISDTLKSFFQINDRSNLLSKSHAGNFRFRFFLLEFSIGVISLFAYLYFHKATTELSIIKYGYFLIVTTLFFALKSVLFDILGFVFLERKVLKLAKESYFNIVFFVGTALFPVLIFQIYLPYNFYNIIDIISLLIFSIAYVFVLIKLFQIFFDKIVASFYILLYLCTLEFLPLFALYQVYQFIL
ncbi:MAG: DUF4271 domain-containing protein [Paludibacter sp.]